MPSSVPGLFPNINTCVETPGKSSPTHHPSTLLSAGVWRGGGAGVPGTGGCGAGCGLLHPLGVYPASLLLLIVEAMTLGVPPDGGGSLDQLPGVGIHTPALPTLPIQRHLALRREEEAVENVSLQPPTFLWSLNPRCSYGGTEPAVQATTSQP